MTTVLKLGGSLITEKTSPETVDDAALADALDAVAAAVQREGTAGEGGSWSADGLVLVHGGGSFGHHHAAERGVTASAGTSDARDVVAIHDAMARLNATVVERLHDRDVDALPVRPLSLASRGADGDLDLPARGVERMLAEGFCPVLHGDGVVQTGAGVTILSGDEVVVSLAGSLSPDRVGLCSTVPGVLDAEGDVISRVDRFGDVEAALGGSDATDVTGGMAGKVRTLLELPVPGHVFGPDGLRSFLNGGAPGTLVAGGE
jgi:isopentenyl phosphate kinase